MSFPKQTPADVGPNIVMLRVELPNELRAFRDKVDPAWLYANAAWVSKPWEDDAHITLINTWQRDSVDEKVCGQVEEAMKVPATPAVHVFKQNWDPKKEHPDVRGHYDVLVVKPWSQGNAGLVSTRAALYEERGLLPYFEEYVPHITVGYFQPGKGDAAAALLREHLNQVGPLQIRATELHVRQYKGRSLMYFTLIDVRRD